MKCEEKVSSLRVEVASCNTVNTWGRERERGEERGRELRGKGKWMVTGQEKSGTTVICISIFFCSFSLSHSHTQYIYTLKTVAPRSQLASRTTITSLHSSTNNTSFKQNYYYTLLNFSFPVPCFDHICDPIDSKNIMHNQLLLCHLIICLFN